MLGAAYIRGAAIDTTTMKGSKHVIVITPPVARRAGWKDDETSVFYIKCRDEAEVTDVSYKIPPLVVLLYHLYFTVA